MIMSFCRKIEIFRFYIKFKAAQVASKEVVLNPPAKSGYIIRHFGSCESKSTYHGLFILFMRCKIWEKYKWCPLMM